ncbi:UNVERIFIED_ORG: hypothetical protein LHK14_16170 [Roseateles sp. XES5]|nr:hypothetical protein [Roseateles sp. XES5]
MAAMVAAGPFWPVHFAAAQDFVFGAVVAATKEGGTETRREWLVFPQLRA